MKPDSLDDMINTVAEVCKPLVVTIEGMTPTTKDHYGDYISTITKLVDIIGGNPQPNDEMTKKVHLAIGVALQRAGANKNGVQSALRVMGII